MRRHLIYPHGDSIWHEVVAFLDCMNNGGTSRLFIDFNPSPLGKVGQVIMFLHDPDCIEVIADSFDECLQKMIDGEYGFICEDNLI